jgi:3-deoxy-D-manno-octulosonate 8-phosphate phosphatase (KDO 8-P phosphatase)
VLDGAAAARVRLVVLDVDGVLTDNGVYIGAVGGERVEFKRFDIQDGLGLAVLRLAGLEVAVVSGRVSASTALRMKELGIAEVVQDDGAKKLPALRSLLASRGLDWSEICYVGDDLADVPVMRRAGVAIAVQNAVPEARALARFVTERKGGDGAVREAIEMLLRARGEWDAAVQRYYRERGDDDDA